MSKTFKLPAQQAATAGAPSVSQQYIRQQVAADMAPLYAAFGATPPAVQAPAPLPARFVLFTLRDLRAERKRLDGFLSLGNEVGRAAEYDEWIAALEAYAAAHGIGAAAQGGEL